MNLTRNAKLRMRTVRGSCYLRVVSLQLVPVTTVGLLCSGACRLKTSFDADVARDSSSSDFALLTHSDC